MENTEKKVDAFTTDDITEAMKRTIDNLKQNVETHIDIDNKKKVEAISEDMKKTKTYGLFKNIIAIIIIIALIMVAGFVFYMTEDLYMYISSSSSSFFGAIGCITISFINLIKLCLALAVCTICFMIGVIIVSAICTAIKNAFGFFRKIREAKKAAKNKKSEESLKKE